MNFKEPEDAARYFTGANIPTFTAGWKTSTTRKAESGRISTAIPSDRMPTISTPSKKDMELQMLPKTSGFFFGESCPEDKLHDLRFIKTARQAIRDGYPVYTSW